MYRIDTKKKLQNSDKRNKEDQSKWRDISLFMDKRIQR